MAKGKTNNPNGRPAGKPNRITKELREALKSIFDKEIERLPGMLEKMSDADRIEILIKLMPYVIPKAVEGYDDPENNAAKAISDAINYLRGERNPEVS